MGAVTVKNRRGGDEGQALVEFAIVLPLFLLLLVGIIEMAGAWQTLQIVTNAAREGARRAVVPSSSEGQATDAIHFYLASAGLEAGESTVDFRCGDASGSTFADGFCPAASRSGRAIEVTLSYPYTFRSLGPVLNMACGGCGSGWGTIPLRSVTVMRNE